MQVVFARPGATFSAGGTTYADPAAVRDAFVGGALSEADLKQGLITAVDAMLAKLGLSAYAPTLAREDVTLATLKVMTDDDLAELGLPKGPRVQLLAWAKQ